MRSAAFVRLEQGDKDAACAALALVLDDGVLGRRRVSDRRCVVERSTRFESDPTTTVGALLRVSLHSPVSTSWPAVSIWAPSIASLQCSTTGWAITMSADELFTAAVAEHEDLGSPTWVARKRLDWAEFRSRIVLQSIRAREVRRCCQILDR